LFKRLVRRLGTQDAQFFVHVDLRAKLSDFTVGCDCDKTSFLQDRIFVNHGGFTLTWAQLRLLEMATSAGEFDYCISLSGQDYPVKSNDYIMEFLTENAGTNFINFYPLVGDADFTENIRHYHFVDQLNPLPTLIRKPIKACVRFGNLLLPDRSFVEGMVPYRGSQWLCLTGSTAKYIVDFANSPENGAYLRFFRHVDCSDEIFFQTIVLNSPFAQQCRFYERDVVAAENLMKNENKAYLHYIDWSSDREDPAVLDMRDYELLKNTDKLFARKFDEKGSKQLLERIDRFVLA
jgi:core-2/I-Branching enzyme